MSKLPEQYKFVDFSDYGRSPARWIVLTLKSTSVTPVQVTTWFIISGLLAIGCILCEYYYAAGFFLIMKSVLDAADGELSRVKNTPSFVGRYYDSIADVILNFLFLLAIWYVTKSSLVFMVLAFIGVQLQGTLYNYYYIILRNKVNGDMTSRVFEEDVPKALEGETQSRVNLFHKIFQTLYFPFDKTIYIMDKKAIDSQPFPKWFMTLLSILGLGFQLLILAVMLVLHLEKYVLPFFIFYSLLIFIFIGIRRVVL